MGFVVKKRWWIIFAVLGIVVVSGILLSRPGPGARSYRGKSIKAWALQLNSSSPPARAEAAAAFKALGTNAVPALVRLLKARDSFLRRQAWMLAAKLPAPLQAIILPRLQAPEAEKVRLGAARSLAALGPEAKDAVPALGQSLRSDAKNYWDAGMALGSIGKPAVTELMVALAHPDPRVRRVAAWSLGKVGPEAIGATAALLKALDDEHDYVRVPAADALSALGPGVGAILTKEIETGGALARRRAAKGLAVARA